MGLVWSFSLGRILIYWIVWVRGRRYTQSGHCFWWFFRTAAGTGRDSVDNFSPFYISLFQYTLWLSLSFTFGYTILFFSFFSEVPSSFGYLLCLYFSFFLFFFLRVVDILLAHVLIMLNFTRWVFHGLFLHNILVWHLTTLIRKI